MKEITGLNLKQGILQFNQLDNNLNTPLFKIEEQHSKLEQNPANRAHWYNDHGHAPIGNPLLPTSSAPEQNVSLN